MTHWITSSINDDYDSADELHITNLLKPNQRSLRNRHHRNQAELLRSKDACQNQLN